MVAFKEARHEITRSHLCYLCNVQHWSCCLVRSSAGRAAEAAVYLAAILARRLLGHDGEYPARWSARLGTLRPHHDD